MTTRSVVVRLTVDTAQAIRDTQAFGSAMGAAMDEAERKTARQSAAIDKLGGTAGKAGAVAAGALFAMGKAAMDWESQWAGVEKTVDGTASQMAALEGEIRGLARTMPATHQEIAATAEAAGQLGVAREDIVDFTKTMVMLGETTNITSDDAATSIAQFMNVMGTASDQVDEIGNTLVDLGNKGASTEAQILDLAQRLSGAGALIGASEQDVLALASSMANLGIQSELGGGAIQRVFTKIYESAAKGADGVVGFAEVSGMSAQEFADQWANDPIRAFDAFLQGLGRVQDSGGNVIGTLDELGIEGTQNLQVMLRLAGAGDMLTTSLEQSRSAWSENRALIEEYGKRAETTGAQAQVAWNQIKDAGIEAGDVLLPVVAKVADGVGTMADVFGQLPGPVQSSVTGLLAIAAVVGGGTWFAAKAIGSITETRSALSDLASTSPRTAKGLSGVAKAAAGLAVLQTAVAGIAALQDAMQGAGPDANELTSRLLDLQDGRVADLGGEFDDLSDSIGRIANKNVGEKIGDFALKFATLGQVDGRRLREAEQDLSVLDKALVNIASGGSIEQAQDAFVQLAEAENLTAQETEWLLGLLPGYSDALSTAEVSARTAADGEAEAGAAAAAMGAEMAGASPQVAAMSEALMESRKAAGETANEFFNLGEGLNDSKVSLGEWIGQMREQADALRDFRLNAEEAAENGLDNGLIRSLQDAGPEGALRMKQLADASDKEIRRANRAWELGQEEIGRYTDAVGGVPPAALEVDGSYAMRELQRVWGRLNEYGLTTATAKAALDDVASGRIKTVQGLIDKYGMSKKEATALLRDEAKGKLDRIIALLNQADGWVAESTIRINTIRTESFANKRRAQDSALDYGGAAAAGGIVPTHIPAALPAQLIGA